MKTQTRIDGTYSIVSAFTSDCDAAVNQAKHDNLIRRALTAGLTVEELIGRWHGTDELSVKLSGIGADTFATAMAFEFSQEAFIVVAGGLACVIYTDGRIGETFTRFQEVTEPYPDNCSITRRGLAFRFI